MLLQGSLSIERMCQLAGVSRAGFYRSLQDRAPVEEGLEVRSVIQQIAVEHRRRYGYRRIDRRRGKLCRVPVEEKGHSGRPAFLKKAL
jgi:putative transposase